MSVIHNSTDRICYRATIQSYLNIGDNALSPHRNTVPQTGSAISQVAPKGTRNLYLDRVIRHITRGASSCTPAWAPRIRRCPTQYARTQKMANRTSIWVSILKERCAISYVWHGNNMNWLRRWMLLEIYKHISNDVDIMCMALILLVNQSMLVQLKFKLLIRHNLFAKLQSFKASY